MAGYTHDRSISALARLEKPIVDAGSLEHSHSQGFGLRTKEAPSTSASNTEDKDLQSAEHRPDEGNTIDWDGPRDPQNPQNWESKNKWSIIFLVSAITFNQYIARYQKKLLILTCSRAMSSTIFAPGVPQAMSEFGSSSQTCATLLISIYVIGLAVGPLFLMPLSELYGRTPLMHATNFAFLFSAILCAVSVNIPMLLIFRLLMGVSTISLGGGYVADIMEPERRGRAMNVWTVGPVLVCLHCSQACRFSLTFSQRHLSLGPSSVGSCLLKQAGDGRSDWLA